MADNDTLELAGDWEVRYGYAGNTPWGTDESGHIIPGDQFHPWIPIHFEFVEPNNLGGKKYKGISANWPATILAETYYNGQGVQLFSMFTGLGGTYELHCGVHYPFYQDDPDGVHVVGSWCSVGGGLESAKMGKGGNPHFHLHFIMRKKNPGY